MSYRAQKPPRLPQLKHLTHHILDPVGRLDNLNIHLTHLSKTQENIHYAAF